MVRTHRRSWRWTFVTLGLALAAAVSLLHAQRSDDPKLGQPGKDVSWVPTPDALVERILEMADVKPGDYLMDLGSGDGRLVIAAGRRGVRAMGIEYDPSLVAAAQKSAQQAGVSESATFVRADLFDTDLSRATVITMFLLPEINLKLRPRLLELAPGTRIVSNTFTMEEWDPDDSRSVGNGCASWCTALMWIVPAKVAGTWTLPQGTLKLTQQFQRVSGVLEIRGKTRRLEDVKLRGDQLTFVVGTDAYAGRVDGNAITGTVVDRTSRAAWTASRLR